MVRVNAGTVRPHAPLVKIIIIMTVLIDTGADPGLDSRMARSPAPQSRATAHPDPAAARPGLGASQLEVLLTLKRRGPCTIAAAGAALPLATETLREHLRSLVGRGLVVRSAMRHGRPGRPEIVYALAPAADAFFPRRESVLLAELVRHLLVTGREAELRRFFGERAARRREVARSRLEGLRGRRRLEEVARILTEDGYMAELETDAAGRARGLRLCHCPLGDLVSVTPTPCGAELAFVRGLLGRSLARTAYLPDGDASCSYRLGSGSARRRPTRTPAPRHTAR